MYLVAQYQISQGLIDYQRRGCYIHLFPPFKFLTPLHKRGTHGKKEMMLDAEREEH